jgi:transposase
VKRWCIPPPKNGEFVAAMEDILEVYTRGEDPLRPLVCLDEQPLVLHGEAQPPAPPRPKEGDHSGQVARQDYEWTREGTASLFLVYAPLLDWRHADVRAQRTKRDWAEVIKELIDVHFPQAERIVLVLDNLNTHTLGALYDRYSPAEARRLARKLEIHYTPKHGSWLNMAEIELSVVTRQCLKRRIPDLEKVQAEVRVWERRRNRRRGPVNWRFTTADARIKLKRLYPSIED